MKLVTVLSVLLFSSYLVAQNTATEATQTSTTDAAPAQTQSTEPNADAITAEVLAEANVPAKDLRLQEGVLVNLGLTYFGRKIEDAGTTNDVNTLNSELRAGYNLNFGLFAGVTGHYDTGKSLGETVTRYMVGPTVGYSCSYTGLFAAATYYVFGNQDGKSLGEYEKIEGLQLDLAYPLEITSQLKFGPQLTYRSLEASDSDTLADNKTKELVPFMGLWYIF